MQSLPYWVYGLVFDVLDGRITSTRYVIRCSRPISEKRIYASSTEFSLLNEHALIL